MVERFEAFERFEALRLFLIVKLRKKNKVNIMF
jgi:hypothetical protein